MEKLKKKNKWFYVVDWAIDIGLIITFIYFSITVGNSIREYCLQPRSFVNVTQIIESNITGEINGSIRTPF
ncbi:MAG: hypothetical protein QXL51_01360 [Candidatus Aenigmatarchaeota archaeon]